MGETLREKERERQSEKNNKTAMWLFMFISCCQVAAYFTYILLQKKKLFIYNYIIVSGSGCTGNPTTKSDN